MSSRYRRYILAAFANATQELADFGMTPPKARAPRTSAQKAAARPCPGKVALGLVVRLGTRAS